jgi:hypothetical protein
MAVARRNQIDGTSDERAKAMQDGTRQGGEQTREA